MSRSEVQQVTKVLGGAMLAMGMIVFLVLMSQPGNGRSQVVSTVGMAIDAPATLQMERDAQAHALAMARVEAERAKVLAEQRTLRLLAVVAGVTAMGLCLAAWQGFATRPRVVYLVDKQAVKIVDGYAGDASPAQWEAQGMIAAETRERGRV